MTKQNAWKLNYTRRNNKECRPVAVEEHFEYCVVFNADSKELNRLADELQKEFELFPIR